MIHVQESPAKMVYMFTKSVLFSLIYWIESIVLFFIPKSWRFKDVKDDVVLITGGGFGFGRLLAIKFASLGSRVVIWDLSIENMKVTQRIIQKDGGICWTYQCDVSDRDAIHEVAKKVRKDVGNVTILVNNAGICTGKRLLDLPDDKIIKTFQVNTYASLWTIKEFVPGMIAEKKGHLVTVASCAAYNGQVALSDYCASKAAALVYTDDIGIELKDGGHNIKTTVINPYFMRTGMFNNVTSPILPILKPEFVAEEAMKGILIEQKTVLIPNYFSIFVNLKQLLPIQCQRILLEFFGAYDAMKNTITRSYD